MDEEQNQEQDLMQDSDMLNDLQNGAQQINKLAQKRRNNKRVNGPRTLGEKAGDVVGKGTKVAGKGIETAGAGAELAGKGMQVAGKGMQLGSKALDAAGSTMQAAGNALSSTGLGSILGAPMSAIGSATKVASKGLDAVGKGAEKAGQGVEEAGNKAKETGKKINEFGNDIQANKMLNLNNLRNPLKIPKSTNSNSEPKSGFQMPKPFKSLKNNSKSKNIKDKTNLLKLLVKAKTKKILIIGGIILAVLLIFIIIFLIFYIKTKSQDGKYIDGDKKNIPYVITSKVMDKLVIVSDSTGKYVYAFEDDKGNILTLDETLNNILDDFSKNKVNAVSYLGISKGARKNLLKKMIQAEIATQYPSLDESEDLGYTNSVPVYANTSVKGCDTNLDVTVKENFITDFDKMNKALSSYNSTLAEHTQDFLDLQDKYGINAVFVAAVCVWETSGGTSGHAVDGCNNWGNIDSKTDPLAGGNYRSVGDRNWAIYPDAKTGIEAIFSLIAERGPYVSNGQKTISQIFLIYNSDDPGEPGMVATSMAKMYSAADITNVNSGTQSGAGTTSRGNKTGDVKVDKKIDEDKTVKGGIIIERKDENGEVRRLKYTSTDNFDSLLLKNTDEVLNYYTLKRNVAGTRSSSAGDFSGNTNGEIVWNYLISKGLSETCSSAVLGNLIRESGLDPGIVEIGSGAGYGLAQWTGTRRTQLEEYAKIMNKPVNDIELQLQFFWMETDPSAERVCATLQWSEEQYQQFISMTSIEEATEFFCTKWERPGVAAVDSRINFANDSYSLYSGSKGTSSSSKSDTKNSSNSSSTKNDTKSNSDTSSNKSTTAGKISTLDNFLFIGDSRYAGIESQLSSLGNNITVAGVVSSNPGNWVETTKNGSGTVLSTSITLPESASGVSVMLGVNNLGQMSEMQQVLNNLHERYPNAPIIYSSIYHMGSSYNNASNMNAKIDEFNQQMQEFCSQNSWATYIDINNNLNDESGYLKGADASGIHIQDTSVKDTLVNNIKSGIMGTSSSGSSASSASSATKEGYSIVVANKKTVTTTVTDVYDYGYTISSNSAYRMNDGRGIAPTSKTTSNTTYSSSSVNYQDALKNYTLYFDFLWAVLVNTDNSRLVTRWAELICNNVGEKSGIYITVYNNIDTNSSSSSTVRPPTIVQNPNGYDKDVYEVTETTDIRTVALNSKLGVTKADTWLLNYENDAKTYKEFQAKTNEVVAEKLDPKAKKSNIIKILRKNSVTLGNMVKEKFILNEMIKDNEKISFMGDIYDYILKVATGKIKAGNLAKDIGVDTTVFDLSAAKSTYQKKLVYTSITISEEEKELLYKFVEQVAVDGSKQQKEYIASVILNRVLSSQFPNTVKKVISQKYAFENYDSSKNDSIEVSNDTKTVVDNIIVSGDASNYSVYFATSETASSKKWDTKYKATVKDSTYNYYTTDKITKQLQKYEINVATNSGVSYGASDLAQQMVKWAEQWVGKSQFYSKSRGLSNSKELCARFVMSAYDEVGLGYYGADSAKNLPRTHELKKNSDGTVDWSEIPVGAAIVWDGPSQKYGHTALYVGNGYVIEAGSTIIAKNHLDSCFGKNYRGTWAFATKDQQTGYDALVSSVNSIGGPGYTKNDDSTKYNTGIAGTFSFNGRNHNVYTQDGNGVWSNKSYSQGTYASSSCGASSVAIIASGYGNNVTPYDTGSKMYSLLGLPNGSVTTAVTNWSTLTSALQSYGLNCKIIGSNKETVINHLKSGGTVIMLIHNSSIGASAHFYGGHYVTLLGIDDSGKIFLGDPAQKGNNNGWCDQSQIFKCPNFTACLVN